MDKSSLRHSMKKMRADMDSIERQKKDNLIYNGFMSLECVKNARWIYTYVSYGTEVDTLEIIKDFLLKQKSNPDIHIAAPRVDKNEMEFYEIRSIKDLKPGYNGILEPDNTKSDNINILSKNSFNILGSSANTASDKTDIVMIMPGLVFDKRLGRIGYGGGFYDRYIARHKYDNIYKIAVAYDFQVLKDSFIEMESHDIRPDIIITDKALYSADCN